MKKKNSKTVVCGICKKEIPANLTVQAEMIRPSLQEAIVKKYPDWKGKGAVCLHDLKQFRHSYVQTMLEEDKGQLSKIEKEVVKSLAEHEILSRNVDMEFEEDLSLGQRVADKVAGFGGSWSFIISFFVFLMLWMVINAVFLNSKAFDPFPFILLNLCLSTLAALQAPVIMMSQNRQEARDRARSQHDYQVNLKAELEIRHINEKIDYLLQRQWQRLMEIQQIQMDLMEEVAGKKQHGATAVRPDREWNKLLDMQQVQLELMEEILGKKNNKDGPAAEKPPVPTEA